MAFHRYIQYFLQKPVCNDNVKGESLLCVNRDFTLSLDPLRYALGICIDVTGPIWKTQPYVNLNLIKEYRINNSDWTIYTLLEVNYTLDYNIFKIKDIAFKNI